MSYELLIFDWSGTLGGSGLNLFHGVKPMLQSLKKKGYLMAIATTNSKLSVDRILQFNQLHTSFDAMRTGDRCFQKPHPQMIEEILTALNVPQSKTLMVGDSECDMQMAKNAGVTGLGVAGSTERQKLLRDAGAIDCLEEIILLSAWLQ